MYYMQINKNFVHQVGDQPRLYYDIRSANHQNKINRNKSRNNGAVKEITCENYK
jgi:hypothetical protein